MNILRFASKSFASRFQIAQPFLRQKYPRSLLPQLNSTAAAVQSVQKPSYPTENVSTSNPQAKYQSKYVNRIVTTSERIEITWTDGFTSPFHHIWLRDNCSCELCRHPIAEERMLDTMDISLDVKHRRVQIHPEFLQVEWLENGSNDTHVSRYSFEFLQEHCYSRERAISTPSYEETLWDATSVAECVPRTTYEAVMQDDAGLLDWLDKFDSYGFSLLENVPEDGLEHITNLVGPIRNTFWGPTWSVKSEPKPMNLSMTSHPLHPHTDFGWSESPPGVQFLHCLAFQSPDANGGESTLVDGFAVAEWIRRHDPQSFELLSTIKVPHAFSSQELWFQHWAPIITIDPSTNAVSDIRFNQANRSPLQMAPHLIRPYYEALQLWTKQTRSPEHLFRFRLKEGQLLVFNNRRLLHGRHGYNAQRTWRHLKGCYMDMEDYKSKLTMLRRKQSRHYSTERYIRPPTQNGPFDPGYDNYNETFVKNALEDVAHIIASGEHFDDGSCLKDVATAKAAAFYNLNEGTKADYVYQCSLYDHDVKVNLVPRLIGMLRKLEGDHIRLGTGANVDLFEHSLQCATRAFEAKEDEEMVVCALLHDVGEMMSPCNHGEISGAILRPYISPERYWMLAHHEIFQGYYYFHHVGGDRFRREQYADHSNYQMTVDFCQKYDQAAFDPAYESYPVHFFEPMMRRILSRKAYWFQPDHPKTGCVTGTSLSA